MTSSEAQPARQPDRRNQVSPSGTERRARLGGDGRGLRAGRWAGGRVDIDRGLQLQQGKKYLANKVESEPVLMGVPVEQPTADPAEMLPAVK